MTALTAKRITTVIGVVCLGLGLMILFMTGFGHPVFIGEDILCLAMAVISVLATCVVLTRLAKKWSTTNDVRPTEPGNNSTH